MKKLILIITLSALAAAASFADSGKGYATREYPWVMRSTAALGMGNAYHTKSDSKYAPFYNPAGLNRIKRNWRVDILPLGVGINDNIRSLGQDFLDTDTGEESELADLFRDHISENQFATFSFFPAFTKKDLTIGIFGNARVAAEIANPVLPEANAEAIGDAGVVVGIAHAFLEDKLQAGLSGRFQHRWSVQESYLFSDFVDESITDIEIDDVLMEGNGVFFDIGGIYNFYLDGCNPRAGLTVNNIGMNSLGDATDLPWSITLSAGVSPSWKIIKTDILLDITDITRNFDEDNDLGKRVNMGLEVSLDHWTIDWLRVRAGLHQGYPTWGLGVETNFLQINFAHYREEIGAYAGQTPDTRNAIEFILSF